MKNFLLLACCLLLFSCSHKSQSSSKKAQAAQNDFRSKDFNNMLGAPNRKTFTISGTTTGTSSYWGGTPPTRELLERLATPKPLPHVPVYVRRGDTNLVKNEILALCTSDASGNFSFQLPAGQYCIVLGKKVTADIYQYSSQYLIVDTDCLEKWKATCDHAIQVKDQAISGLNINIHSNGFPGGHAIPCTYWNGPLPN